jgi:OmpA-OmpF porin, OOP family
MDHWKVFGYCVCALIATGGAAQADDSGFYAGASIGQARQKARGFEGNDLSYRLFGGWSFNKYLAVEGGYVDGGEQSDRLGSTDIAIESSGYYVTGLAKWPVNDWFAPYVKLGYVFYDATQTASYGSVVQHESLSNERILFGGGLEFRFKKNFSLRADYEKVNVPDAAFDIFSVVATYHF